MTTFVGGNSTTRNNHSNGNAANTVNADNSFTTSNGTYDLHHPRNMSTTELNTVNNGRSYDMYEMRPPPPMYRRVPQPPLPQPRATPQNLSVRALPLQESACFVKVTERQSELSYKITWQT